MLLTFFAPQPRAGLNFSTSWYDGGDRRVFEGRQHARSSPTGSPPAEYLLVVDFALLGTAPEADPAISVSARGVTTMTVVLDQFGPFAHGLCRVDRCERNPVTALRVVIVTPLLTRWFFSLPHILQSLSDPADTTGFPFTIAFFGASPPPLSLNVFSRRNRITSSR
jgi:hypothetical protein